jgi:DNA-binding SARP family transcriptional activator
VQEEERPTVPTTFNARLLGDFSLICDGRTLAGLGTPRLQSLVAYLILHRDAPQSRRHIAYLF